MTNRNKTFLILALLILAGAFLILTKSSYKKQQGPVQSNKLQPAATTNTSTTISENRASPAPRPGVEFESYPEDLPKDLAVVPASFDQSLRIKTPEGKEIISITYTSQNSLKTMVDMYKLFLSRAEWNVTSQTLPNNNVQLSVSKGGQRADITVKSLSSDSSQVFLIYYK